MLGKGSSHAEECLQGGYIGADFGLEHDLSEFKDLDRKEFNLSVVPLLMARHPAKTRISAGLAGGALWTVSFGLKNGDVVLCPDGNNNYAVGTLVGDYAYTPGQPLMHRRAVRWQAHRIPRKSMGDRLRHAAGSIGTVSDISDYQAEIDELIGGALPSPPSDPAVEVSDPSGFRLEKYLEQFLFENWDNTLLGKEYDIYEEDGEPARQYETDTGPLDILAVSKDRKTLLVVELKREKAADAAVGQVLRYMSFVKEKLLQPGQKVRGMIIAREEDPKVRRALSMTPDIDFLVYRMTFSLTRP
jgi:restriction system protein